MSMNEQPNILTVPQNRLISLPQSKFSTVIRLRVSLRCNECGTTWGTNFLHDYTLPIGWDECRACRDRKSLLMKSNINVDRDVLVAKGEKDGSANS